MLTWCKRCENKASKGFINTLCLACKWQYVGQECFDRKSDYFKDCGYETLKTPSEYFGDSIEYIGVELI